MYFRDSIIVIASAIINIGLMVLGAYTLWTWTSIPVFILLAAAFTAVTVYVNTLELPEDFDE